MVASMNSLWISGYFQCPHKSPQTQTAFQNHSASAAGGGDDDDDNDDEKKHGHLLSSLHLRRENKKKNVKSDVNSLLISKLEKKKKQRDSNSNMELLVPAANRVEVRRRKTRKNLGRSMRKWRRRMSKLSSLVPLVVNSIRRMG